MDSGIGRILQTLRKSVQLDNTLVLVPCQDNALRRRDQPRRAHKAAGPPDPAGHCERDGPQRRSGPARPVKATRFLAAKSAARTGGHLPLLWERWANVSNTPFREYKHFVHEGGISTPLIAHWPKGIRRRSALEHQPGHLIDIMRPAWRSRAQSTRSMNGQPVTPMEGRSLVPAFAARRSGSGGALWSMRATAPCASP